MRGGAAPRRAANTPNAALMPAWHLTGMPLSGRLCRRCYFFAAGDIGAGAA